MKNRKKSANNKKDDSESEVKLFVGSRRALYGGVIAAAVALAGQWLLGSIYSGYEARQFLESMSSSALYFGSAIVTASATILALMLTILSLTSQSDDDFDKIFFLESKTHRKTRHDCIDGRNHFTAFSKYSGQRSR